ncbi:MAG: 2-C-methyl-D-erythritol 4-phosphate cytidylyltransferase [Flavobacteriales bacterium]
MERYAVIVAGGKGARFGGGIPKQFQEIAGEPVLVHTLRAFEEVFESGKLVLVLAPDDVEFWKKLLEEHPLKNPPSLVLGGTERFRSVKNGLEALPVEKEALVAVHDAVRPLIRPERIRVLLSEAEEYGNAIPSVPLRESLRRVEKDGTNESVDREAFRAVQTPQCFHLSSLKNAMEQEFDPPPTDEASVMDGQGHPIHLAEGDPENIKITEPMDLSFGAALLQDR